MSKGKKGKEREQGPGRPHQGRRERVRALTLKEKGDLLFNEVRLRAREGFANSLVPDFARERFLAITDESHATYSATRGEFIDRVLEISASIIPEGMKRQWAESEMRGSYAICIRPTAQDPVGHIYISPEEIETTVLGQQSKLFDRQKARDNVLETLLEQVGQGLRIQKETALGSFDREKQHFPLMPFWTVHEFAQAMQAEAQTYRDRGADIPQFTAADLVIVQDGFSSHAMERKSGKTFLTTRDLVTASTASACVLQTLLLVITYGQEEFNKRKLSTRDEAERNKTMFTLGMQALKDRMQKSREFVRSRDLFGTTDPDIFYIKEIAALNLLRTYYSQHGINSTSEFDAEALKTATHDLFRVFGQSTLDEFHETMNGPVRNSFQDLMAVIDKNLDWRKGIAR